MTELLKGVLEGCVLMLISRKETYGYEITNDLNSMGFVNIVEGTVYTILLRFEKNNLVNVEKKKSQVGPARKFYSLNENGQEKLKEFLVNWDFLKEIIETQRKDLDVR